MAKLLAVVAAEAAEAGVVAEVLGKLLLQAAS